VEGSGIDLFYTFASNIIFGKVPFLQQKGTCSPTIFGVEHGGTNPSAY
jgi:hypothetical protein